MICCLRCVQEVFFASIMHLDSGAVLVCHVRFRRLCIRQMRLPRTRTRAALSWMPPTTGGPIATAVGCYGIPAPEGPMDFCCFPTAQQPVGSEEEERRLLGERFVRVLEI
eukprot:9137387-Lingulodinium_polyedra.AAC.1